MKFELLFYRFMSFFMLFISILYLASYLKGTNESIHAVIDNIFITSLLFRLVVEIKKNPEV